MTIAPTKPERLPITVVEGRLNIPHLGMTLRSIMGAAIRHRSELLPNPDKQSYPVLYKQIQVAEIRLGKDFR